MNERQREALESLINYNWWDEKHDYDQQEENDRTGHVFLDLVILRNYLTDTELAA